MSVKTKESIVAIFGAIIPEPLAMAINPHFLTINFKFFANFFCFKVGCQYC